MRDSVSSGGRLLRRDVLAGALALAAVGLLVWLTLPGGHGVSSAAAESAAVEVAPQTDAAVPAREVSMVGATPAEAGGGAGETWGLGNGRGGPVLVRYTQAAGWTLGPPLQDETGEALTGFTPDKPEGFRAGAGPSPLAGQMTADGAGVLVGFIKTSTQVLLVREPGNPANSFRVVKPVPEVLLEASEKLFGTTQAPLVAPLDEEGGHAGALIVPVVERGAKEHERWVLHWDGAKQEWTREAIEKPASAKPNEFHVLGIGASSPGNAWLIAQLSEATVGLFRRHVAAGEATTWQPVAIKAAGVAGEPLTVPVAEGPGGEHLTVPGAESEQVAAQVLSVTAQGLWVDGERAGAQASTTLFLRPEAGGGFSVSSWCSLENAPAGAAPCQKGLPESLPAGPSRSLAWDSSAPYGERVISGLPLGVTLRLDGEEFTRVAALGGHVGADYGAAFSSPREGWLGEALLPVHLTTAPAGTRLTQWPAAFRYPLLAIASQPGQPVGALTSGAVAVGDRGQVARYQPGVGWVPETLVGASGKLARPRLRAVAWPTPGRVYAVGDGQSSSQIGMWLWRGETGLWEPDPAEPVNFRGNLLGVAFDPANPSRGYAVGESGVLLRYGKSWTQEPYPAEAPCTPAQSSNAEEAQRCATWSDASFTSIAFAGSRAMVAYRVLPNRSQSASETGGVLVNDGSGWRVDTEAAAALGAGRVPWAVAGLPDGGAAFTASGTVFEREGSGVPWHATPTPFPATGEPGSLAIFREGGAVRVIASGAASFTARAESEPEAPPGSPPSLIPGFPLGSGEAVIRQTASGWNDELHELNNATGPPGNWLMYDSPREPDATAALLVDPTGSQGWAVGGVVEQGDAEREKRLDTSEVARYGDGAPPPGIKQYTIGPKPAQAMFAIAGNAQCAAPCGDLSRAGIGPDVWLSAARAHAQQTIPSLQGFIYTGARTVSPQAIAGHKQPDDKINYELEVARYRQILTGPAAPAYVAAAPTDLEEAGTEHSFLNGFAGFLPFPGGSCNGAAGCQSGYYAATQGSVRVVVLDGSSEFEATQESWLRAQLEAAREAHQPAIAVGNVNLAAEIAAQNHPGAANVAAILGGAGNRGVASAYFYDAPEENVKGTLVGGPLPVPMFGTGTLGYVSYAKEGAPGFNGASGYLLAEVETARPAPRTSQEKTEVEANKANVKVQLIPNIDQLALEAKDGLLLHRSQAALFAALARRPRAGSRSEHGQRNRDTDPYIPIPSNCVGASCNSAILPEYEFSSSNKDKGDFVKLNSASPDEHAVELGPDEKPIPDSKSGLFCAFNAGETKVRISAGGLSYELPVTVQAGSVRRPCGTTRLSEPPVTVATPVPAAPLQTQPSPAGTAPTSIVPVPPLPPAPIPVHAVAPATKPPIPPFIPLPAVVNPIFATLIPPIPTPARPTPPSGTSPVTQPVEAPEREEESEEATESVGNNAVAYRPAEYEQPVGYLLGLVLLAALAGAAVRRPRRGRREVRVAPATISAMRAQRRASSEDPWRRRR